MPNRGGHRIGESKDDVATLHPGTLRAGLRRLHMKIQSGKIASLAKGGTEQAGPRRNDGLTPRAISHRWNEALIRVPAPYCSTPQPVIKRTGPHQQLLKRIPGILSGSIDEATTLKELTLLRNEALVDRSPLQHRLVQPPRRPLNPASRIDHVEQHASSRLETDRIIVERATRSRQSSHDAVAALEERRIPLPQLGTPVQRHSSIFAPLNAP